VRTLLFSLSFVSFAASLIAFCHFSSHFPPQIPLCLITQTVLDTRVNVIEGEDADAVLAKSTILRTTAGPSFPL
jgi:hypothetical protein